MIYEFFTGSIGTIMEMFKSGGIITYLITIIGIYGVILSSEKIYKMHKISKISLPQIIETVNEAMERGGSLEALRSIGKYPNPISKIISEALKIGYRNNVEVEDAMERVFIVEMGRMTKGLNTLKTIIEITTLFGFDWNGYRYLVHIQGNGSGWKPFNDGRRDLYRINNYNRRTYSSNNHFTIVFIYK